ncbi:hypothetical protein C8Q79DRAFT_752191 [Trametes meyenii]|nr:hypothetical protein C8Q79DRAFT_752191 [Trametes meyenii]
MMKTFCPLPRRYAVIRMDPVGMVRHYNDPIALAEAQEMRPKKYLVYLRTPMDLPTPTNPWFRFEIDLIGTTRRPEDKEQDTSFPSYNCYHWVRKRIVHYRSLGD